MLGDFLCADNISVVRVKSKSGFFDIKPRNVCALAFRISGEVDFCVGGSVIKSRPGDVFFMPKDTAYTALYTKGEIICIHFTTKDETLNAVNISGSFGEVYGLFLKAELLWQEKAPGYKYFVTAIFYEILGHLSDSAAENKQPGFFKNAVSTINNGFRDSSLCISQICRTHGISETYFRFLFKKYYGKTPVEYITSLRLEYGASLLYSGYTVEQAAMLSGFSDAKYFSRVVKKHYGCTPSRLKSAKI